MTVAKPRKRWIVSNQDTRDNEDTSSLVARPKGDIRLPISQQRVAFNNTAWTSVGVIPWIKKGGIGCKVSRT